MPIIMVSSDDGKPHSTKEGRKAESKRAYKRQFKRDGGRTRLLEELGRVEAEPSNRNRRAEISRVHGELNKGYKAGGKAARKLTGDAPVIKWLAGGEKGKPHSSKEGREAAAGRKFGRMVKRGGKLRVKWGRGRSGRTPGRSLGRRGLGGSPGGSRNSLTKRTVSSSTGRAFRKAKQRKSDIKFKELVHKKTGSKKTPLATSTGYLASEQRKMNKEIGQKYNPYNPKSKKYPGGYEGKHYRGSMDKRLGLRLGGSGNIMKKGAGKIIKSITKGAGRIGKGMLGIGGAIKKNPKIQKQLDLINTLSPRRRKNKAGGGRIKYASGGVVMAGKKVGCQIK